MTSFPPSVHQHIAAGRKIEAIKEVRSLTGWGLREAKDAVERIERGENVLLPENAAVRADELAVRVRNLVAEGRTIEAIKDIRSATGADLKQAKQLVDQLKQGGQFGASNEPLSLGSQQPVANPSAKLALIAALLVLLIGMLVAFLAAA